MAKTDTQRITDTLTFLQNTNIVTLAERTPAYQLAQDFINAVHPATGAGTPAYHQFSMSMSLGYHQHNDPNDRRKMARALFLLWKAIKHNDNGFTMPFQTAAQINQATAERTLRNYIRKARCVYESVHGGHAGADHVLTQVFQGGQRREFLRHNKVIVAGSAFLDPGQAPENVLPCKFGYNPARDRYEFRVREAAGNGEFPIDVESVTAFHWTDQRYVPLPLLPPPPPYVIGTTNFGQLTGIRLSGAEIMVTTQFTGCSFCMAEHLGHMYCAHVSPYVLGMAPNTDGLTLATRVIATGAFANAGGAAPRVYGRNLGSAPNPGGYDIAGGGGAGTYMTIVGFPGGTSYEIYSQTTRANAIRDARQIF